MGNLWRKLGLTYVHYSNIAAQTLRLSLKPEQRLSAEQRNRSSVRFTKWSNGRPEPALDNKKNKE